MNIAFSNGPLDNHNATSKEDKGEDIRHTLSILVVTNRPSNFRQFVKQFVNTDFHITAVTDMLHLEEFNIISSKKISIIGSRSNNFSYLVNLGARYIHTSHFILLYDDETLDERSIHFIQDLNPEAFSYKILVETTFGNRIVKMWTHFVPRLFERSVKFRRRVHEVPILKEESAILSHVKIKNNSYTDWDEFWKKAISTAKREQKSTRRFFELITMPLYWFFINGKCSDGDLGIKLVWSSIVYAGLSLKYGIHGQHFYDIDHIELFLENKKQELSSEETNYIRERLDYIKVNLMNKVGELNEELEQLSSPF